MKIKLRNVSHGFNESTNSICTRNLIFYQALEMKNFYRFFYVLLLCTSIMYHLHWPSWRRIINLDKSQIALLNLFSCFWFFWARTNSNRESKFKLFIVIMTKLKYELINNQRFVSISKWKIWKTFNFLFNDVEMRNFIKSRSISLFFLHFALSTQCQTRIRNNNQRNIFAIILLSRKFFCL